MHTSMRDRFHASVWSVPAMLPRVSPGLTAAAALTLAAGVAGPVALMLVIGQAVGLAPQVAAHGRDADGWGRFVVTVVAVGLLLLINQILSGLLAALSESLGRRLNRDLRGRVITQMTRPDGQPIADRQEVQNLIAVARGLRGGYAGPMGLVVGLTHKTALVATGLAAGVVLLVVSPWAAVILIPVDIAAGLWMRTRLKGALTMLYFDPTQLRRAAYLHGLLVQREYAKEVRNYGLAEWLRATADGEWSTVMRQVWADRRLPRAATCAAVVAVAAAHVAALSLIAHQGRTGVLDPGALVVAVQAALAVFTLALTSPWDELLQAGREAINAVESLERITHAEATRLSTAGAPRAPSAGSPHESIELTDVRFTYPGEDRPVLDGVTATIRAGRSHAIVGHNGSGKSTVLKLLLGLYRPDSGTIRVDGTPLAELDLDAWRRHCAVVFQDFLRLGVSVRDSVEFGAWDHRGDADALTAVAGQAGLDRIVADLPAGWDTVLSPQARGGADLSGGQWQRVAIARALYAVDHGASVLALDEPTAGLDAEAERSVYESIRAAARGQTLILVSHRFSTVRHVDHIFVLDGGVVVEQGDHASLVEHGGLYAQMFAAQSEMVVGS